MSHRNRHLAIVSIVMSGLAALAAAQVVPLPLEDALSTRIHNPRSSFDLSPDGEWVAHDWTAEDALAEGELYTPSGIAVAEGWHLRHAGLTNTRTGETIELGDPKSSSWGPVWSPDGRHVAFYADAGGTAGLWVWDAATRTAARVPGVIVRPFFGFEIVRWSPDGQHLLCKILPDGMTVAQANALLPKRGAPDRFPPVPEGAASVFVRSSHKRADEASPPLEASTGFLKREMADLAIIDIGTLRVSSRVATDAFALWYAFSPDGRYVAYTDATGFEPHKWRLLYNIVVVDLATGAGRTLAERVPMGYGIELNWSPDGTQLAYIESEQGGRGDIVLLPLDGSGSKRLHTEGVPSFSKGEGEWPPFWDASGQRLYALGVDDRLWQLDWTTGAAVVVGDIPGHRITGIVSRPSRPTLWTTENGRTAWVVARDREQPRDGLYGVDLTGGPPRTGFEDGKRISNVFNLSAATDPARLPTWPGISTICRTSGSSIPPAGGDVR